MATHATGTFEVTGWDEQPYQELDGGGKLTRASVTQKFAGDVEGDGAVEYLMCHRDDGTASFVGLQRVAGKVGDRSGDFVLQLTGTFDGGAARGAWSVVPGSATNELRGLRGDGGFEAKSGPSGAITLDYDFE